MHALPLVFALTLAHTLAVAGPRIDSLPAKPPDAEPGCRFYVKAAPEGRRTAVLEWVGAKASMQVDGRILRMDAREEQCLGNCVAPGKTGVRVIHFLNSSARATLRIPASCHKDSEVCSGLLAGEGNLVVSTGKSRTALAVWNEDCDQ